MSTTPERLLSMGEVQERLNVGRSTAFDLVLTSALRSVKIGARRLVSESALADFIATLAESA